jgi:pimeloyl-ACP methyl ester carboxylesterase
MSISFLARPSGRIAYEDEGAGPLAVLVPSLGDVRAEYRFLTPDLVAGGYRVVTVDLRGQGESSTGWGDYSAAAVGSDIVALLRELNAGPAHLIGTSMGAAGVAWAAAEAPDLVATLVLIGPFVRDVKASLPQRAIVWSMVNVGLLRPWGPSIWGTYYNTLYPTEKPADLPSYIDSLKNNLRERGRLEALQALLRSDRADVEPRLREIRAPSLVVMGSKDPDFASYEGGPQGEALIVANRVNGSVLLVEDAGHYPHAEMPRKVTPAILDFLSAGRAA